MEVKIYKDKQHIAEAFAEKLSGLITSKEKVNIALSGGSTPKVIFDFLAEQFGDKIDWSKLHLYWGDERCVPPIDGQSNFKMTVNHLLSKIDIPFRNIHRVWGENDPSLEAQRYSTLLDKNLPKVNGLPQFDILILGMGDDGHTASIFPHEIELWDTDSHCIVATHPDSGQKRISLTGQIINNADEVCFLVTGENKKHKVLEIINGHQGSEKYPASLVAPNSEKLEWYLDESAASLL